MSDYIKDLRRLMIGRTVVKIECPMEFDSGRYNSICLFTLDDSTVFELCANDLGAWIDDDDG